MSEVQAGQSGLGSVYFFPLLECPISLLQSAVVGNVLALGHFAVDVRVDVLQNVGGVLVDYALGSLTEVLYGLVVPPLLHDAVLVELSPSIVEAVGDLVTDHHADSAVVQ